MKHFINEDVLVKWIIYQGGILHTRKFKNFEKVNLSACPENTLVCITGYDFLLKQFFERIINHFKRKIILITIESDEFTMRPEYLSHPLLKHWYTWNKPYEHDKVTAFPIGLNYDRQQVMLEKYLATVKLVNPMERKLMCINCSLTTDKSREKLHNKVTNEWQSYCDVIENISFIHEYYRKTYIEGVIKISVTDPKCYDILSKYKFILSPRGAGEDCHRTWEALYLDMIPIVLSSSINELYEDLPIVVVDGWDDINEEFLNNKFEEISKKKQNNEYKMEKIYLDYWFKQFNIIS